jgi:hypothetical protein
LNATVRDRREEIAHALQERCWWRRVAEILGKTEGRVRQRLTDHTLLGVRTGGAWRIPGFQFDDDTELSGWDRVMSALPHDVHPLTVARFHDTPHVDLDVP